MKLEIYNAEKHKHFKIMVIGFDGDCNDYDVFGNDDLKSEANVYQSCISFPHDDKMLVRHADGIALFNSFKYFEIVEVT